MWEGLEEGMCLGARRAEASRWERQGCQAGVDWGLYPPGTGKQLVELRGSDIVCLTFLEATLDSCMVCD